MTNKSFIDQFMQLLSKQKKSFNFYNAIVKLIYDAPRDTMNDEGKNDTFETPTYKLNIKC